MYFLLQFTSYSFIEHYSEYQANVNLRMHGFLISDSKGVKFENFEMARWDRNWEG